MLAVRWCLRYGLSYHDLEPVGHHARSALVLALRPVVPQPPRNSSPSEASTSTTSPCTGGCDVSRRCSSMLLGCVATPLGMVGSWTRCASSVQTPPATSEQ